VSRELPTPVYARVSRERRRRRPVWARPGWLALRLAAAILVCLVFLAVTYLLLELVISLAS
jgi:hypothetical protein